MRPQCEDCCKPGGSIGRAAVLFLGCIGGGKRAVSSHAATQQQLLDYGCPKFPCRLLKWWGAAAATGCRGQNYKSVKRWAHFASAKTVKHRAHFASAIHLKKGGCTWGLNAFSVESISSRTRSRTSWGIRAPSQSCSGTEVLEDQGGLAPTRLLLRGQFWGKKNWHFATKEELEITPVNPPVTGSGLSHCLSSLGHRP